MNVAEVLGKTYRRLHPRCPELCRACGDDAWTEDDQGGIHPCCDLWSAINPGLPCTSCAAAKAGRRREKGPQ